MRELPEGFILEAGMETAYKCPKCGKKLLMRKRKSDSSLFLGCLGYPDCKFTDSFTIASSKQMSLL